MANNVDSLIALFGDDSPPDYVEEVIVPGYSLPIRIFKGYSAAKNARAEAEKKALKLPLAGTSEAKAEPFSKWPYLPATREEARLAMWIKECIHESELDTELTDAKVLQMVSRPSLVNLIEQAIDRVNHGPMSVVMNIMEQVESEKKESASKT